MLAALVGMVGLVKTRVVLVGIGIPLLIVLLTLFLSATFDNLPPQLPSHWGGNGADAFLPPGTIVQSWLVGAGVALVLSISVTVGSLQGRWTPLGKGITAVGVGAVCAVGTGLLVQLSSTEGRTTQAVVELGLGPSFLGVMGGFVLGLALALSALPKGVDPESS